MVKRPAIANQKKLDSISVYFATNRNRDEAAIFGSGFSESGISALRFGSATASGTKLEKVEAEIFPEDFSDSNNPTLGSQEAFEKLRASMKSKKRDTVFFIHGFNYTFKEAITGAATLKRRFDTVERNWIVFTWPSDGSMEFISAYKNDRLDAEASGPAMARGILKAAEFMRNLAANEHCEQRIHLFAHSMGNYVLRHAVQQMQKFVGGRLPRLFDQIILFAADEDNDALELEHKLRPLERLGRRTTIYYNMQDVALLISDITKGNPNRLGDIGPQNTSVLPTNFTLVNASAAAASDAKIDATRHQYYQVNDDVRADIQAVLEGRDDIAIKEDGRRIWRPEGRYWRLESKTAKGSKEPKTKQRGRKK